MLNTSTDPPVITACSTMLTANAVLPMEGRAATMTRSEACQPVVMRSKSVNPDA